MTSLELKISIFHLYSSFYTTVHFFLSKPYCFFANGLFSIHILFVFSAGFDDTDCPMCAILLLGYLKVAFFTHEGKPFSLYIYAHIYVYMCIYTFCLSSSASLMNPDRSARLKKPWKSTEKIATIIAHFPVP